MNELEIEIERFLKEKLCVVIREETDKLQTLKTIHVELLVGPDLISSDSVTFPID